MESTLTKVLYVTSRFPALSMTFVANEMTEVSKLGIDIDVATLWKPLPNHTGHPNEIPFLDKVAPTPVNFSTTLRGLFTAITNTEVRKSVFRLLPGHLKSPWLFAKLLTAIPKGITVGKLAKQNGYHLIHAHFLTTPTTVALIASSYSGIPFTCTAHAFDITSTNPRITNGSVAYKCQQAAAVITISQYNQTDILTRWPKIDREKLFVIYNGIDTSNYSPTQRSLFPNTEPTRIVCISNLNEKKGHIYLVRAVSKVLQKNKNIRLDLYGTGPMQQELEQLIAENNMSEYVTLHGSVNQSDTARILQQSDIFALASIPMASGDADGLPTVLIEALSSAMPTISTQVTGIPEIIIDRETGLCVPPADDGALADAILWMTNNPDKATEMGKQGRQLVLKCFDARNSAAQLLSCWQTLLAENTSRNNSIG